MFAIIDVETTGLNPSGERITEIAVYLHDGHKVTDEYQTLLNPEKRIPHQITGLTGISNRMVADQPRFCNQINRCYGACLGKEPAEEYNQRVDAAIEKYIFRENDFFVIDQGRRDDELAIVKVCNGSYQGFGYISKEASEEISLLNENIRPYADNKDIQVIIKGYLRKYPEVKTVRF